MSSRSSSRQGTRIRRLPLALVVLAALLGAGDGAPAAAQLAKLRFDRLSREQNLSQVTILDLVEDRQGFLWIATQDGLNRYNGYEVTVFKHDPSDPESLSYSNIIDLYQDREGTLWVGVRRPVDLDGDVGGLIGVPLDIDELVAFARTVPTRRLDENECAAYSVRGTCPAG